MGSASNLEIVEGRSGSRLLAKSLLVFAVLAAAVTLTGSPTFDRPAAAQSHGAVPGNTTGSESVSEFWRGVRKGVSGTVSIKDRKAAVLVQSHGEAWRAAKNGVLARTEGWILFGAVVGLALFRLLRGRIRIEAGAAGRTIERFSRIEREVHWLTAASFLTLAFTGLNVAFGRYLILPVVGAETFAMLTYYGKLAHNYIAFAFIAGLIFMFVIWVRDNLFDGTDLVWIAKGGGLLFSNGHPPAKKFNFGQKCIFWLVILGGATMAWSGIAMMFPFEVTVWDKIFGVLGGLGLAVPLDLTPMQDIQLSVLWHGVAGVVMIAVILGHIYIGSPLGMEGAIGAVGSGQVDVNWAREHHSLWAAEVEEKTSAKARP